MPDNTGLASAEVARDPMNKIWVEVGVADHIEEKSVLDSIEGLADIDCHRSSA